MNTDNQFESWISWIHIKKQKFLTGGIIWKTDSKGDDPGNWVLKSNGTMRLFSGHIVAGIEDDKGKDKNRNC